MGLSVMEFSSTTVVGIHSRNHDRRLERGSDPGCWVLGFLLYDSSLVQLFNDLLNQGFEDSRVSTGSISSLVGWCICVGCLLVRMDMNPSALEF